MTNSPVIIDYYTDILCVWAYFGHIRISELEKEFGDKIQLNYHFINLFGNNQKRIAEGWEDGGYRGYSDHVKEVAVNFPHVQLNDNIWLENAPASSMPCHLAIKAAQICDTEHSKVHAFIWDMRKAFFQDAKNIALKEVWLALANAQELDTEAMLTVIDSGEAFAALAMDLQQQTANSIEGSPTYVMNNGRQKLYGNLGYRAIAANVQELLTNPLDIPSWC